MVEINIPDDEKHALGRVDARELDRLIDDALREEPATRLFSLPLSAGAPYVARRLRTFERALADHGQARAPRKRAEMGGHIDEATGFDTARIVRLRS